MHSKIQHDQTRGIYGNLAALFLAVMILSPAAADTTSAPGKMKATCPSRSSTKAKAQTNVSEFIAQKLNTVVPLENLPPYTGQIKIDGLSVLPNLRSGPTYVYQFSAKEDSETILAWYADALRSYGWKLDPKIDMHKAVIAVDNKQNRCQIIVMPSAVKGFRQDVLLQYKVRRSQG